MNTVKPGYVKTSEGVYLVRLPSENEWGFVIADEKQDWPGGVGAPSNWEPVPNNEVPLEARERLDWLLAVGD